MAHKNNPLDAFLQHKATIDAALKRLQALSDDHFHARPDNIDWGDVGDIAYYAEQLTSITDRAFKEGEYAQP